MAVKKATIKTGQKNSRRSGAGKGAPLTPAEKHDFYLRVLDEADRLDFELAAGVQGIDDEIALLRIRIKSILASDPENTRLILEAANVLSRLVKTRYNISREQKKGLKEAIGNVLKDVALPLGIGIGTGVAKGG